MIKAYNVEIPGRNKGKFRSVVKDVEDFLESGRDNAEIEIESTYTKQKVASIRATYANAITRMKLTDKCKIISRGRRLFLVKTGG